VGLLVPALIPSAKSAGKRSDRTRVTEARPEQIPGNERPQNDLRTRLSPMVTQIEIPPRVRPVGDSGYLEELTKAIFRSGFSWRVVREKWDAFRRAFDGFNLDRVAAYDGADLVRLFNDSGIVRNRRKIMGTVENARRMGELARRHASFYHYLRSLDSLDYHRRVRALTSQFYGLGRTGAFVFLHCVDEETPNWHDR